MFRSYNPRARATIKLSAYGDQIIDVSADLVNLQTSKAFGRAAGGWQFVLPPGQVPGMTGLRYDELIVPDDIVTIEMDPGDGTGFGLVMLGLVNRVARSFHYDREGRPLRTVRITGLDFGKLLVKHDCGWNIALSDFNYGPPDIKRINMGLFFTGTAAKMTCSIFETLFQQDVYQMANYYDFTATTDDTWETYDFAVNYASGSVWEVMKRVANEPYNILRTETTGTKANPVFMTYLDKMPIGNDGKLAPGTITHEIDVEDIVREDCGVCDDERVVYHIFKPQLTVIGQDEGRWPIWYTFEGMLQQAPDAVPRHGAKLQETTSSFAKYEIEGSQTVVKEHPKFLEEAKARSIAFWNRMKNNAQVESGTYQIHLAPAIRAGQGLIHKGIGKEYFVECVEHQMSFGEVPLFITTLSVTRGQQHSQPVCKPADAI